MADSPDKTSPPELSTRTGSCHCGAVRFEVDTDLSSVISCNCSMCQRAGTLLAFVPADRFRLLSGQDAMTDYQFNRMNIHHQFCKTCGIKPFGRGTATNGAQMVAVNARCLDGVEIADLNIVVVDGRSF